MAPAAKNAAISFQEELRSLYGEPIEVAVRIKMTRLDAHHKNFIAHSPFLCLASSGPDGTCSVSPGGCPWLCPGA